MKFGMKVGLWTLITGKLLWSRYLGNGFHGDQKLSKSSVPAHFGIAFVYEKSGKDDKEMLNYVLPWKQTCYHSNQKYVINCLIVAYFGNGFGYGRFEKDAKRILRYLLPRKPTCCQSNQNMAGSSQ